MTKVQIVWSRAASDELDAYYSYLLVRNVSVADVEVERICRVVESLAAGEFDGPTFQLKTGEHVQSWPVPPLRIFYRREEGAFLVVHVHDQRRPPIVR